LKGFKDKSGKFRPTGSKSKSSLKKSDIRKKEEINMNSGNPDFQVFGEGGKFASKEMEELAFANMKRADEETKIEDAIELVHDNYDAIMHETAIWKEGRYMNNNVEKIIGVEGGEVQTQRVEAFCGATTGAIEEMLQNEFGDDFGVAEKGYYHGEDRKHSEGFNSLEDEVYHEWFRLPDGTIIDNACGQFQENNLNVPLSKEDRLRIIRPDDERQELYKVREYCKKCASTLKGEHCETCEQVKKIEDTPEFKSGMAFRDVTEKYRNEGRGSELGLTYKKTL